MKEIDLHSNAGLIGSFKVEIEDKQIGFDSDAAVLEAMRFIREQKREALDAQVVSYPYAKKEVYQFLKLSTNEGAHTHVPDHLQKYRDAEFRWIRIRNMAGTYFGSSATYGDIGAMHGITKEAVAANVKTFIDTTWKNSNPDTKELFPRKSLELGKVQTVKTRIRKSESRGGNLGTVLELLDQGKKVEEIARETDSTMTAVKRTLRPHKRFSRSVLRDDLNGVKKFELENKQTVVDKVTRGFYQQNRDLFVTKTEICNLLKIDPRRTNADRMRKSLSKYHIPVGEIEVGDRRVTFVLMSDFLRFKKIVYSLRKYH